MDLFYKLEIWIYFPIENLYLQLFTIESPFYSENFSYQSHIVKKPLIIGFVEVSHIHPTGKDC